MFAANARIGVARSAIFPALSLTGQGGAESYQLADLFKLSSTTWLIGAVMSLPIVDGGRNRANIRRAEAALEESVGVYRQRVLAAFGEVEDNLVGLRTLDGQARATDEAVASARRAARPRREALSRGPDRLSRVDRRAARAARGAAAGGAVARQSRDDDGGADPRARRRLGCRASDAARVGRYSRRYFGPSVAMTRSASYTRPLVSGLVA